MRRALCTSEKERAALRFHPKDPVWAPHSSLARVRKALEEFDSLLRLWWSPMAARGDAECPGRWRVVRWLPNLGEWDTVLYLEAEGGGYRQPDCADTIIQSVRNVDLEARGLRVTELIQQVDDRNDARKAKQRSEAADRARRLAKEQADFQHKRRLVIPRGARRAAQ